MKANKFMAIAMMVGALAMVSCNPDPDNKPDIKTDVPEVAATEGAVTVVWNIANIDEMCDVDYVFAGNYNGWNTEPENMAHFEAIPDYKGWYKAVVDLGGEDHLEGKPCALGLDGTFPSGWDYQWIGLENKPCEILKGSAELVVEYDVESKLVCGADADVVFVKSHGFKTNPCVEAVYDDVTFNLTVTVPVSEGGTVYIVGDAFEKSWDVTAYPMTGSGSNWTITLPTVVGKSYKFAVNGDWANDQMNAPEEGKDCVKKADNMTVDFTTMNPTVYGFLNYGIDPSQVCEEEAPVAEDGVLYIKCAGNGWAWAQMTAGDDKTFTYESTVADEGNVGANINVAADDNGAKWYDLGDMAASAHGLAKDDAIVYTFTQTDGADGTLSVAKK